MGRFQVNSTDIGDDHYSKNVKCPNCGQIHIVIEDGGYGDNTIECRTCHCIFRIGSFTDIQYYAY